MLTIKPPIRVTAKPSIIKLSDQFGERMEANYQVMASTLSPEKMLHYISDTQDIYMEGDSMTSVVTMNQKIHTQQINVELINNVLNRILVAGHHTLSYQDRTFIEMVLNKIGITDVKQFMNQINELKQSTANVNQLIDLYQKGGDELKEFIQYHKSINQENHNYNEQKIEKKEEKNNWLHQDILNRLDVGVIYKEIFKTYQSIYDTHKYIDGREWQIGEQLFQSNQILLNQMKNEVLNDYEPLEYHLINTYETGVELSEAILENDIQNTFMKAVLVNAIHHSYALRYQEIKEEANTWYNMLGSLSNTVLDTMERFSYFHEYNSMKHEDVHNYNRMVLENNQEEITLLQELMNAHNEKNYLEYDTIQEQKQEVEEKTFYGQQINYLTQEEQMLKQELQNVNQLNVEKREKLEQIVQSMKPEPKLQINREKAIADARRAIENPQEIMMEYLNTQNAVDYYEAERSQQAEKVMGKDIVKIIEKVEQYHRNPNRLQPGIVVNDAALELLVQDASHVLLDREIQQDSSIKEKETAIVQETQKNELKTQLKKFVQREIVAAEYESIPRSVELHHKVIETGMNEEILEEIRNVNRSVVRTTEEHQSTIQENTEVYKSVTNRVNQMQLQHNEELTNMIANNVKEQIGSLSEQVYRKLEKRMDSEKRRRGL